MSLLSGKRIIVAGAGIAGLAFINSLHALWTEEMGQFPTIIQYERDNCQPDHRREGYSMSIRSGGISLGMQALQRMDLLDAVLRNSIIRMTDKTAFHGVWTLDWTELVSMHHPAHAAALPRSPIRIARSQLRKVLLDGHGIRRNIICGITCLAVRKTHTGITVQLSNGEEDTCDFLVVADGAKSKLRASLRPNDTLDFAGPVSITGVARFSTSPPAPIDKAWGIIPSGHGVSLFLSPMDSRSAHWCISYMATSPRLKQGDTAADLLREAKYRGTIFGQLFFQLLDHTDPRTLMVLNAMDKKPFSHHKSTDLPPGVMFIGDSNHALSAFAANGANLALIDGFDLAECLCTTSSFAQALREYDDRSLPRASLSLMHSREHIALLHSTGISWLLYRSKLLNHGRLLTVWRQSRTIVFQLVAALSASLNLCIALCSGNRYGSEKF